MIRAERSPRGLLNFAVRSVLLLGGSEWSYTAQRLLPTPFWSAAGLIPDYLPPRGFAMFSKSAAKQDLASSISMRGGRLPLFPDHAGSRSMKEWQPMGTP